jgi:predicted nucleic acid-binding protein
MKIVVDTSVWSLALRRNNPPEAMPVVNQLYSFITDGRVVLLGAVRQEVLSGIRNIEQFTRLKDYLHAFPDLELTTEDYELAAEFYNMGPVGAAIGGAVGAAVGLIAWLW